MEELSSIIIIVMNIPTLKVIYTITFHELSTQYNNFHKMM